MFCFFINLKCLFIIQFNGVYCLRTLEEMTSTIKVHCYQQHQLRIHMYIFKPILLHCQSNNNNKNIEKKNKKSCTYTKRPRTSSIEPTRLHLFPSDVTNGTIFMGYVLKYF